MASPCGSIAVRFSWARQRTNTFRNLTTGDSPHLAIHAAIHECNRTVPRRHQKDEGKPFFGRAIDLVLLRRAASAVAEEG